MPVSVHYASERRKRAGTQSLFNHTRIATVVVCSVTSNLRLANAPGNVLLEKGEANLPRPSVVNVSQIYTVDKVDLVEWIGALSADRIKQVVAGVRLLTEPGYG